MARFSSIDSPR